MNKYFQEQLRMLHEGAREFARKYPAAAPMLLEQGGDPDAERILEGTAYLCAKIHERLDQTAPELIQTLLREVFPESVMPVVAFSYPPQRGLVVENGRVRRKYPQYQNTRSQELEKKYHDCGQFYACRTDAFLRDGTTDVADLVPIYLTDLEVQDIDTEEDWEIAELKYRRLHTADSARA